MRGSAAPSRALPSFSVIEIIPVSAIAKLAPVMPASASRYFRRSTRRAIMVSSSGLSVGSAPSSRVKSAPTSVRREVHGREDDVVGRLPPQLHDELAEVGLHDLHARRLDRLAEADLLRGHGLRLHDRAHVPVAEDLQDRLAGLAAVSAQCTLVAARLQMPDANSSRWSSSRRSASHLTSAAASRAAG